MVSATAPRRRCARRAILRAGLLAAGLAAEFAWAGASHPFVRRDARASLPAPVSSPAQLYALHCAGCHRFDGQGQPSYGVPPMPGVIGRFLRSAEGRAYLVQVPGVNNAGLSDAQIADLTNWVVRRFGGETLPSRWEPFVPQELPALRASRPDDLAAARRRLLEASSSDEAR